MTWQKEMNDLKLQLKETSAGKTLYLALEDLVVRQQTTLSKIRSELKEPNLDDDELKLLMDEYQNLSGQLQRARKDLQKMKISIGERILQIARSIDWTRLFRSVLAIFLFVILTQRLSTASFYLRKGDRNRWTTKKRMTSRRKRKCSMRKRRMARRRRGNT